MQRNVGDECSIHSAICKRQITQLGLTTYSGSKSGNNFKLNWKQNESNNFFARCSCEQWFYDILAHAGRTAQASTLDVLSKLYFAAIAMPALCVKQIVLCSYSYAGKL